MARGTGQRIPCCYRQVQMKHNMDFQHQRCTLYKSQGYMNCGPFIFNEVGGAGGIWRGGGSGHVKLEGGHPKNIREKGGGWEKYFRKTLKWHNVFILQTIEQTK